MGPRLRFSDATGASSSSLYDLARREPRLNVDALAAYLSFDVPVPESTTLYAGVTVEPNAAAWGSQPTDVEPVRDLKQALKRVRRTLDRVVERAIGDSRRVVVFAGGGIDSAVLLAVTMEVARRHGVSVLVVTMDFESPGDDRPHMRALEACLGCEVIRVSPAAGAAHREVLAEGIDGVPVIWPFSPLHLALFKLAKEKGADRFLTGIGGDHFFDGDPRAFAGVLRRDPLGAIAAARAVEGFDDVRFPVVDRLVRPHIAKRLPLAVRRHLARRQRRPPVSAPWAGPKLLEIAGPLWERKLEFALTEADTDYGASYFDHPERRHYAWLVHQEQQVAGLERHDPYFTHEVREDVRALPPEMLLVGGRRRGFLRELMRGTLPDSLLDRGDKAEFAPAFRIFFEAAGGTRAFAKELEGKMLARLGLVDPRTFTREATRALEMAEEGARYMHAWAAVATEAFLLRHPELV